MPEITKYLERAAEPEYLKSYYGISKYLGMAPSNIYRVRDHGGLTDAQCLKLAEAIDEDPMKIIAARNVDQAKDEKN